MPAGPIIPSDSPSIFDVIKTLSSLQRQAIVRPNNPPAGIGGYLFDIPGEDQTILTSQITDSYLEDNTAVNDQIALSPEKVTLRGVVAELVLFDPTAQQQAKTYDPLKENEALIPPLTLGTLQTDAEKQAADDEFTGGVTSNQSLFQYYESQAGDQPQTKQAKIFNYFYQLWRGRVLFTIETPNGFWTNMAIENLIATQAEDSKYVSDFTITFKKIRTSGIVTVNVGQLAGRAAFQRAQVSQNGNAGTPTTTPAEDQSLLYRWTHPSP